MELSQMIREMFGEEVKRSSFSYDISNAKADINHLKSRMESYDSVRDYEQGDIIEWKPGIKDCGNKYPAYGQPVFCAAISSVREPAEKGPGMAIDYKDLTFAIYQEETDSITFFTGDSQRFRKYRKPSE